MKLYRELVNEAFEEINRQNAEDKQKLARLVLSVQEFKKEVAKIEPLLKEIKRTIIADMNPQDTWIDGHELSVGCVL